MCGPGVPVGCKSGHKKPLMCGLGVAVGCKSGHKKRLMCGAGWLLAAGVAVGCRGGCWLQGEACQVKLSRVLRLLRFGGF